MTSTLNRDAYEKLIEGDREWLSRQPRTLERDHIDRVLVDSVVCYYRKKERTMRGIAPDGDRLDADPTLDDAAVSITDEILAALKQRTDALGDAVVAMETAADKATAEASFELEFMRTVESLAGIVLDYARRTPPAAADTMLANPVSAEVNRTRRARQVIFDKLAGGDPAGIIADARRVLGI